MSELKLPKVDWLRFVAIAGAILLFAIICRNIFGLTKIAYEHGGISSALAAGFTMVFTAIGAAAFAIFPRTTAAHPQAMKPWDPTSTPADIDAPWKELRHRQLNPVEAAQAVQKMFGVEAWQIGSLAAANTLGVEVLRTEGLSYVGGARLEYRSNGKPQIVLVTASPIVHADHAMIAYELGRLLCAPLGSYYDTYGDAFYRAESPRDPAYQFAMELLLPEAFVRSLESVPGKPTSSSVLFKTCDVPVSIGEARLRGLYGTA